MKAVKKFLREQKGKPAYTQMMREPKRNGRGDQRLSGMRGFGRYTQPVGK